MNTLPRSYRATAPMVAMVLVIVCLSGARPLAAAESAHAIYTRSLARERVVRDALNRATVTQLRRVVQSYEGVVRKFPGSGYCDNALWQAGNLAVLAYERFGQAADKRTAIRLFTHLKQEYPSSSLVPRVAEVLRGLETAPAPAPTPAPAAPTTAAPTPAAPATAAPTTGADAVPPQPVLPAPHTLGSRDVRPAAEALKEPKDAGPVTIRDVKRTPLPDGVRVTIEMDGESLFRSEQLESPRRVFFDLKSTRAAAPLLDATLKFTDDIVREIRFGRHPQSTTRVVMDLESVETYSVFTLYNPFRLVVDFRRAGAAPVTAARVTPPPTAAPEAVPVRPAAPEKAAATPPVEAKAVPAAREPVPLVAREDAPELITPEPPAANRNGQFSLSRQLGLGVSRIVLDAGHGGRDPGARANGLNEAELVLDVTLRLRALLEKQPGIEVTLTREGDVYIPLEERTAIANRTGADLFLPIHANASRNVQARGVETYFLNFASNPEAEAVAARENSASGKSMHSLPEIVRAIALNNKIDESRDFADMVQKSMVRRLTARNKLVRDLGVKQAPFVVLIGAGMPSVLAEISFVTNKQEGLLLKTPASRQQIAESLQDAILRYQRSLKGVRAVASRD
jgi:N-acetylmuramoyl-L-alanine amidase